jgi:hypothetical protein
VRLSTWWHRWLLDARSPKEMTVSNELNPNAVTYSKISAHLVEGLERLHRAGGLSLVFLFIGVVLVALGNLPGQYRAITLGIGTVLLLGSFGSFTYLYLQGPVRAIRTLRENQETIDALQELSLELVGIAQATQAFALRYANEIAGVIDIALPALKLIPGVGGMVREWKLDRVQHLSRNVLAATAGAETVIRDAESALRKADFGVLRRYADTLKSARADMRQVTAGLGDH